PARHVDPRTCTQVDALGDRGGIELRRRHRHRVTTLATGICAAAGAAGEAVGMTDDVVLIDEPAPYVRRITLNRPEKRNALNHALRGGITQALRTHDADPDVRVQIVRGAGPSFSAGYELGGGNAGQDLPWYTPGGDGHWPRHVTEGWMSIWDL